MSKSKPEKLQKILANHGLASRREIERWIEAGRVSVNGKRSTLGDRATTEDTIRVDGHIVKLRFAVPQRVLAYNKPLGEVCTRKDKDGRTTVFDRLPRLPRGRWVNIGRLDINTMGLLLFSTDGELVNKLTHPSNEVEREYAVRIYGDVDEAMLQRLRNGVELEDGPAKFDKVMSQGGDGKNHWYHVVLHEGRNREVRRLWESQGVTVSRLIRVRFGPIELGRNLPIGRWRELDDAELKKLIKLVN